MWILKQVEEIAHALQYLPAAKVLEVRDFAFFLRERYGYPHPVDDRDEWTDEDLRDLTIESINQLEKVDPTETKGDA